MGCLIQMRSELEAFEVDESFPDLLHGLDLSRAAGKAHIVVDLMDGKKRLVNVQNVNWATEID